VHRGRGLEYVKGTEGVFSSALSALRAWSGVR